MSGTIAITRNGSRVPVGIQSRGLSGLGRYLTATELVAFMFRHPATAYRIAATKAVIHAGMYNHLNNESWWNDMAYAYGFDPKIGLIPTYGLTVDDSQLGRVTIFPAINDVLLTVNNPPYSPGNTNNPYPGSDEEIDWQGPTIPQVGLGLGALALLGVGLLMISRR